MPRKKRSTLSTTSSRSNKRSRTDVASFDLDGSLIFDEDDKSNLSEPFVASAILLKIYFNHNGESVTGHTIPLNVMLCCDDGREEVPSDKYEVNGAEISNDGVATLQVTIGDLSKNYTGQQFVLIIKPSSSGVRAPELRTAPFVVISQRLKIAGEVPNLWYKDEGGRDKSIDLRVELCNKLGMHKLRDVPLLVTLHYDTHGYPQALAHAKIGSGTGANALQLLQMARASDPIVRHGVASVRLRINDVSKNHMTHAFIVKIAPNTLKDPELMDIAAAYSTPITVKSKRNNPKKKKVKKSSNGVGVSVSKNGQGTVSQYSRAKAMSSRKNTSRTSMEGAMNTNVLQDMNLPQITSEIMRNIASGNVSVQHAGALIGHWGYAVNTFLGETNQRLQNLMMFNEQVAQPVLRRVSCYYYIPC